MKLDQLNNKMAITITVKDYLTDSNRPSSKVLKEIDKLYKYFTTKFLKKFKGEVMGNLTNSYTGKFELTIDFNDERDRIKAVRHIRNDMDSDYISGVKSI